MGVSNFIVYSYTEIVLNQPVNSTLLRYVERYNKYPIIRPH